jgi:Holliday junction resolvase
MEIGQANRNVGELPVGIWSMAHHLGGSAQVTKDQGDLVGTRDSAILTMNQKMMSYFVLGVDQIQIEKKILLAKEKSDRGHLMSMKPGKVAGMVKLQMVKTTNHLLMMKISADQIEEKILIQKKSIPRGD